jgi:hypothetical protein
MEHSKYEAKARTSYNNSLNERRFKVLLFLYRMAGIPINKNSASRIKAVDNTIVIVCFYITNFCVCVDAFVHRNQLKLAMKKFRLMLGNQIMMCSHLSVR